MTEEKTYKEIGKDFIDVSSYIWKTIENSPFVLKKDIKEITANKLVHFMTAYDNYLREKLGVRTSFLMDDFATTGEIKFVEAPDFMKIR